MQQQQNNNNNEKNPARDNVSKSSEDKSDEYSNKHWYLTYLFNALKVICWHLITMELNKSEHQPSTSFNFHYTLSLMHGIKQGMFHFLFFFSFLSFFFALHSIDDMSSLSLAFWSLQLYWYVWFSTVTPWANKHILSAWLFTSLAIAVHCTQSTLNAPHS